MSLSTLLAQKDVRERFRTEFPKPEIATGRELYAPPLTTRYSLVGTAFDYLLRFYVQRLNEHSICRRWVAEVGLEHIGLVAAETTHFDVESGRLTFPKNERSLDIGRQLLERARRAHAAYMLDGAPTTALLQSAIGLAQLDVVHRSGYVDERLGVAHPRDVEDLRRLIALVKPDYFRSQRRCLLNPDFGNASRAIGGADADLVVDDMLIEIKTTKTFELSRDHFNQLVGYFVLHRLAGFNGAKQKVPLSKLAIYFARHAHLEVFDAADLFNVKTFPLFVAWFKNRASLSPGAIRAHEPLTRSRATRATRRPPGAADPFMRGLPFDGFVRVTDLQRSNLAEVPRRPGVYVILCDTPGRLALRPRNPAYRFKGRDPTISPPDLKSRWVPGAHVIYIGKAGTKSGRSTLRSRLRNYLRSGEGLPSSHWGGRAIWQLKSSNGLRVAWLTTSASRAGTRESALLQAFRKRYRCLPFANRRS